MSYDFAAQQWSGDAPAISDPTAAQSQAVVPVQWSRQDRWLQISDIVTVTLRNTTNGQTKTLDNQVGTSRPIRVIEAKRSLELWVDNSSVIEDGSYNVPAGAALGFADGSSWLHLAPLLTLFEQPYPGGLQILSGHATPSTGVEQQATLPSGAKLSLDDYFEATADPERVRGGLDYPEDPTKTKRQQGVRLRCKFHFEDAVIKRIRDESPSGYRMAFTARPTGHAFGEESRQGPLDWIVPLHYQACRDHLPQGVSPDQPLPIYLASSWIECDPPSPNRLPSDPPNPNHLPRAPRAEDRFASILKATVKSGSRGAGKGVPGSAIKNDLGPFAIPEWHYRFWYDPPGEVTSTMGCRRTNA